MTGKPIRAEASTTGRKNGFVKKKKLVRSQKKKKEEEPNKQSTFVGGKEPGAGAADDMET